MSSPSLPVFLSRRLPSGLSSLPVLRQYRRSLFVTAAAARRAVEPHSNAAPSSTRTEHFYSPADAVVNGDDEKTEAQKRLQHESDLVLETLARSPEQRGATVYSLSFAASGAELPFTPMQRDQLRNVRNLEASAEDPHLSMLYRDIQENFFGEVRQNSQSPSDTAYSLSSLHPPPSDRAERENSTDDASLPRSYAEALAPSNQARVVTEAVEPFRIQHVNAAWTDLCGYTLDEVRGETLAVIQGRDTDLAEVVQLVAAVRAKGEGEAVLVNYAKGGVPFINRIRVQPLRDETGRVTHMVGVLEDVMRVEDAEPPLQNIYG